MLADGRILIVGGVDPRGHVETHVEIIDLAQRGLGQVELSILPRAGHTATLLTDGRVLIAGGRDDAGAALDSAQIWNVDDGSVTELPLLSTRAGHRAVLQGDGTVLLTGGGADAELYVPGAEVIVPAGGESPSSPVILAGSLPEDRATDVPTNTRIALRFSGTLAPGSVGSHSLRLSAGGAEIPTSVSFAEGGRLVFLAPLEALDPGQTYVLVAHGLRATDASPLSTVSLSFTTTGAITGQCRRGRVPR